nr:GapR family DNA-binding domain-containing protein [Brucella anthropi]
MSNSRLKSFIDRVLRLKEEEDAIKTDIREVYAEMKGEGFDKTVAGQLVAHLRKVEKKGRGEVDNANAIFDLYLNEYENGTRLATHTHESEGE